MGLVDRLEYVFNGEYARRLLIKFFCDKGFNENFDKRVYPPSMQNLLEDIPEFMGKVELIPHAIEVDPSGGFARLGWNLFVLGNQRMYLGETEHTELAELARDLDSDSFVVTESENEVYRQARSARDIINWVTRVLGRSEGGLLRSTEPGQPPRPMGSSQGTNFFERPKAIRPEGGSQH